MNKRVIDNDVLIDELVSVTNDFKASVIAAEIADNGVNADDIFFKNLGIFKRFFSRDVEAISHSSNEHTPGRLVFELNREGLYDMLPEGVFHSVNSSKSSEKDAIEEFKMHRAQELNARAFFSTFENEFMHRTLQLEIIERELSNNKNKINTPNIFEFFFGKSNCLSDTQVLTLLYILPLSSKIRSDVKLLSVTLSKILGYRIEVRKEMKKSRINDDNNCITFLGESFLGINTTTSAMYHVCSFFYNIIIYDIEPKDFNDFMFNRKDSNVLQFIVPFLFPADTDVEITLMPSEASKGIKASLPEDLCFLGFNSYT